ncbi:MAG: hypothetical protein C0404_05735 [Verrucomicrobia bacterium]|nr:hypothetical protein [Verrucomicrobiota bacterium]
MIWKIEKPTSYAPVLAAHLTWLVLSGLALAGSFVVSTQRIPFRLCMFNNITGYPCISCGFTRGFTGLAHGHWDAVLLDCPLAILLYAITILVFAWNGVALASRRVISRGWLFTGSRLAVWLIALAVLAVSNWVYRIATGRS